MGCPSCQQNNNVIPSVSNAPCTCTPVCTDPVCEIPQPCTEITDSKCIVYTDNAIKCGTDTVVTKNASVSTALTQIVTYFCNQGGFVTSADITCGQDVIVPAGSTIQNALEDITNEICNLFIEPRIRKFVYEQLSVFDDDNITITRTALENCGLVMPACSSNEGFIDSVTDLHVQVYYLFDGMWYSIPQTPFGTTTEGCSIAVDNSTGNIKILLHIAPIDPAVRVRVVVML